MDFGGEESPSKRRCYERSSTPIRELYPYKLPSLLSEEEETEVRENGLDIVEEPIAPAQVQREEDTLRPDDINVDGHDPENYGLSNEAMGKLKRFYHNMAGFISQILIVKIIHVDHSVPCDTWICFLYPESFISEVEEECVGLPNELWQLIFQRVPLLDLVTSGRRVCQRWNQIIADEKVGVLGW